MPIIGNFARFVNKVWDILWSRLDVVVLCGHFSLPFAVERVDLIVGL
jgi:hypothetical protein